MGGALPKTTTEQQLQEHFSEFGTVKRVQIKCAGDGTCKGFAFITFDDTYSSKMVLENYDNNEFEGNWIDCKPAQFDWKASSSGAAWGDNSRYDTGRKGSWNNRGW